MLSSVAYNLHLIRINTVHCKNEIIVTVMDYCFIFGHHKRGGLEYSEYKSFLLPIQVGHTPSDSLHCQALGYSLTQTQVRRMHNL
jgi:hypothetical protein